MYYEGLYMYYNTAVQTSVTVCLKSKQVFLFAFALKNKIQVLKEWIYTSASPPINLFVKQGSYMNALPPWFWDIYVLFICLCSSLHFIISLDIKLLLSLVAAQVIA